MAEIMIRNLSKRFGNFIAVDHCNLVVRDRDFVSLLGPSGCGKTTILRMIAGLETPTEGEIFINGKMVFSAGKGVNVSAAKRNIGFLFQNYALWPHMTVEQNISFGLKNLKWKKEAIAERVMEMLDLMKIVPFAKRYPAELSGGQQQRVAIARTLATKPGILFMDEPLSNLDAKLRNEMRIELKRLHMETESTFVYVTHDQLEAMTLSTKVCLLKDGVLQQYDPPLTVYNQPANLFVADFIGNPTMNFVEGVLCHEDGQLCVSALGRKFAYVPQQPLASVHNGQKVVIGIRPEHVKVFKGGQIHGTIYSCLPSGMETIIKAQVGDDLLTSVIFGSVEYSMNAPIGLDITSNRIVLFEGESARRMAVGELRILS